MGATNEVLLIEDDPDTSRLFAEVLVDSGLRVASCRPDALPERDGYSAILTDLAPGHRTRELAREWVRLLRGRYAVPVIVISGTEFPDGDTTLDGVAADVIAKPVDIDDLVRRVGVVLANRS